LDMFHLEDLSKWWFLSHAYFTVFELAYNHYLLAKLPSYLNVDLPWVKNGGHLLPQKCIMMPFFIVERGGRVHNSQTARLSNMY